MVGFCGVRARDPLCGIFAIRFRQFPQSRDANLLVGFPPFANGRSLRTGTGRQFPSVAEVQVCRGSVPDRRTRPRRTRRGWGASTAYQHRRADVIGLKQRTNRAAQVHPCRCCTVLRDGMHSPQILTPQGFRRFQCIRATVHPPSHTLLCNSRYPPLLPHPYAISPYIKGMHWDALIGLKATPSKGLRECIHPVHRPVHPPVHRQQKSPPKRAHGLAVRMGVPSFRCCALAAVAPVALFCRLSACLVHRSVCAGPRQPSMLRRD